MQLKRDIGLIGAAFIALNGIVGAGIFAAPADLVAGVGGFSAYLFLMFGALMVSVALVFAELASKNDLAGGPAAYGAAAFGPFTGFQAGWLMYLARLAAFAANANAFATYLAVFFPGIDQGLARGGVIVALVVTFAALNITGVKQAVRTLNLITLIKLAPLLVLMAWGIGANLDALPAPTPVPPLNQVGGVSLLLLYAFVGFEIATLTAGETGDAKRRLPLALIGTIVTMAVLYFLIQLAYVATMRGAAPEDAPLAAAAAALAGPWGAAAIAIAALVSIGGNLFAQMLTTPRITYALSQERSLPAWFGAVSARFATPANSILALALIAGVMAVSGAFVWLAVMSSLARLMVYLLCTASLFKLRGGAAGWGGPVLGLLVPLTAIALCLWAAAQAKPDAWAFLVGFVALGTALYALNRWRTRAESHI